MLGLPLGLKRIQMSFIVNESFLDLTISCHYRALFLQTLANLSLRRLGLHKAVLAATLRNSLFSRVDKHRRSEQKSDGPASRKTTHLSDIRRLYSCALQDRVYQLCDIELSQYPFDNHTTKGIL